MNWEEKFASEVYLELFRFRKRDMNLLATALEVFYAGESSALSTTNLKV